MDIQGIKVGDHIYFLGNEFILGKSSYENYYLKPALRGSTFWEKFKATELDWKTQYYELVGRRPTALIPTFSSIKELIKFTRNYKSTNMHDYDMFRISNPYALTDIDIKSAISSTSVCRCTEDVMDNEITIENPKNIPIIKVKHKKINLFN